MGQQEPVGVTPDVPDLPPLPPFQKPYGRMWFIDATGRTIPVPSRTFPQ
jgi:hypothetical protein